MNDEVLFTVGQFAKIHNLNRRTLHYYDEIKLFSPNYKKDNNYRYYSLNQSAELQYILALRELGMSIAEIKEYLSNPKDEDFIDLTDKKIDELYEKISYFDSLRKYLINKKKNIILTHNVKNGDIQIQNLEEELLYITKIPHKEHNIKDMGFIMNHLEKAWKYNDFKVGCGSYISIEKIKKGNIEIYDGLFSLVTEKKTTNSNIIKRDKGTYLCGYNIGHWNKIPSLYKQMLQYAEKHNIKLSGNAYESGISEFASLKENEYVVEILIKCDKAD